MQAHVVLDGPEARGFSIYGSLAVAVLFAAMSLAGLLIPSAYALETDSWKVQAVAQDWFDLVIAAPCVLIGAIWASRGSLRGVLVLGAALLYAVYTLLIYTFAVHLNPLFLLYCATLGLALYSLIASTRSISETRTAFGFWVPRRVVGGFLVFIGLGFGGVWLAQLIPAAITGETPAELVATGLFTNPIHVIDLSFILPLHVIVGVALWRGRALGSVLAPVLLGFGALMTASIAFLAVRMEVGHVAEGGYPIAVAMSAVAALSLALLAWMLSTISANRPREAKSR